ncbi:hypothetical protein [Flammeovirga kamogawensis]|uniref:Uncharacterized protein n=1 Tax=Flammeovirga kamogawensis TaxID=373891 RepID=A0ABX8H027_9BACT|nr:hypothetical protein [Flammeovirga kamogawensis]MBB6459392.1 hypothetical protein [Flammeovirga kamogawensis]QWG08948.1 hypothetical protein KM029_08385 [Flammeovirga kamogawensis]TRX67238.1 hypothetical protein EO216_03430 [Flammeovirga kamogawensis]
MRKKKLSKLVFIGLGIVNLLLIQNKATNKEIISAAMLSISYFIFAIVSIKKENLALVLSIGVVIFYSVVLIIADPHLILKNGLMISLQLSILIYLFIHQFYKESKLIKKIR